MNKAEIELLTEYKARIDRLEAFCRNTTASDETIINILAEIKAARETLSQYDTAFTPLATEPVASRNDDDRIKTLLLINSSF